MLAKALTGAAWIYGIASFFVAPESRAAFFGRAIFGFLVVAHLVECALFYRRLSQAPGSLPAHLLQTFVFGMFHVRELPPADTGER